MTINGAAFTSVEQLLNKRLLLWMFFLFLFIHVHDVLTKINVCPRVLQARYVCSCYGHQSEALGKHNLRDSLKQPCYTYTAD